MKRQGISVWLIMWQALALAAAAGLQAAEPDRPETWDSGGIEGWERREPGNASPLPLANPSNCLEAVFFEQSQSAPQVHIVRADIDASDGRFAGNYWIIAVTNVSFKLYCKSLLPANLNLCFYSEASRNWWYYPLAAPVAGEWKEYNVPLKYGTGWWTGEGGDAVKFKKDQKNVAWVGVRFQRNDSVAEHRCRIDDFVLRGASKLKDGDGDGASDWHEFIAGTDAGRRESLFKLMDIGATNKQEGVSGIVLRWSSVSGGTYLVERATDLKTMFSPLASGIPGNPPENEYVDGTATNRGPYYYRIVIE